MSKLMLLLGAVAGLGIGATYWPKSRSEPASVSLPEAPIVAMGQKPPPPAPEGPGVKQPQAQLPVSLTCAILVDPAAPHTGTITLRYVGWNTYLGTGKTTDGKYWCDVSVYVFGDKPPVARCYFMTGNQIPLQEEWAYSGSLLKNFGYYQFQIN